MDPMVSTEWLAARMDDPAVRIVEATWFMPGEGRTGREAYEAGHIPGAVFLDIDQVADRTSDLPHMLPSPEAFAEAASGLGLSREATVVVYDAQGLFSAPRVWWTLRAMGYGDVRVLDGGLKKWRAESRPVTSQAPPARPAAVTPAFEAGLVRDRDAVRGHLRAGDAQVLDARAAARFRGEAPEPRPGLPSGHMPGALNLPWNALVDADGTLKSAAELKAAFEGAGLDLARPVVTTCGSGVSAAILALGLARLGLSDVAVYDGSWTEWASRPGAEIVTGG